MTGEDGQDGQDDPADYRDRLVDRTALAEYLTAELGPADEYAVERHPAGHSNETLFVTWGDAELVVRRPPPGETAETAHDVLREHRVLAALADTDVRVPEPVLACDDRSVLGADFYVMTRLEGDVLREGEPARFADPASRERIGAQLVDRLAEIHAIDYEAVGLAAGDFGYPEGFTRRQVDRWSEQLAWAAEVTADERPVPGRGAVADWLAANVPPDPPAALVHGDYKHDNVLFAPGAPPRIGAIFDWELSTLGDPFTDLGWLLSFWWDSGDPPVPAGAGRLMARFMTSEGYPDRRALVDRYERATGFAFEHERFYRALAVYKLAGLGEMFFRRYLEGNADDPMYPEMRAGVPALIERARRIIDGEEPL